MKKIYFWSVLTIILAFLPACLSAQERTNSNPADDLTQRETHVTVAEAREVGLKFYNANAKTQLRSATELQLATTYRTAQGEAAFYVFNTQNGFVLVAADRCATPILGYSDEGAFDMNNVPIQMQSYLQSFVEQIAYGMDNQMRDERVDRQWDYIVKFGRLNNTRPNNAVEPLITAQWDQGCYYNAKCPEDPNGYCGGRVPTGCVATAMGMIMHYWDYPSHGSGSNLYHPYDYETQYVNFAATTYDWSNMPNQLTDSSSQAEIDAVSTLLWHCGVAVYMLYGSASSGAFDDRVLHALSYFFNYSEDLSMANKTYDYMWTQQIKANLDLGMPLYYSGGDNDGHGHAWVCDGYDANDFLHFNWGWGGVANGYFSLSAINAGGYQYNYEHAAIFNIVPKCEDGTSYQVTVDSESPEIGSVSGGGTILCGEQCTVNAASSAGYYFSYWTSGDEVVSYDANYTFSVTADIALVAHFDSSFIVKAISNASFLGKVSGITSTRSVYYDDGVVVDAARFNPGKEMYWSIKIPRDSIVKLNASQLTRVSVWDFEPFDGEVLIYKNNIGTWSYGPLQEHLLYRQFCSFSGSNDYVDIPLAIPIPIDTMETNELFIVMHSFSGHYVAPFCRDMGIGDGWLLDGILITIGEHTALG